MKRSLLLLTAVLLCLNSTVFSQDNVPYVQTPPGGLKVAECPMFVCFGFDDNAYVDGIKWFADFVRDKKNPGGSGNPKTYDGAPVRATFFITAGFGDSLAITAGGQTAADVVNAWKGLAADGHEIANHTYSHPHGAGFTKDQWKTEMTKANDFLTNRLGLQSGTIKGFRNPFLEISTGTYQALKELGFFYDCSIEAGYGSGWNGDGTGGIYWWSMGSANTRKNLFWPYTLDNGACPATATVVLPLIQGLKLGGIWELTVYTYLRAEGSGEITGFDYNLWKQLNRDQFVQILKYNFDLQYSGNKCPMTINVHTDNYSQYNTDAESAFMAKYADRRSAVEEFMTYALSHQDVRVVSYLDLIKWMKSPAAIGPVAIGTAAPSAKKMKIDIAKNKYGVILSILQKGNYAVSLTAPNGKAIFSAARRYLTDNQSLFIPFPKAAGVYLLQVSSGSGVFSKKIIR